MIEPLPLRPHHLTCLHFYVGRGYSEAFVARMDAISALIRERSCRVVLTDGFDAICEACPNWRADRNECESAPRVRAFDERTLAEYGLKIGAVHDARALMAAMFGRFDRARFERICGDCEWRLAGVCDPSHPPPSRWR